MNDYQEQEWQQLFDQFPVDTSVDQSHQQRLKRQVLRSFDENGSHPQTKSVFRKTGEMLMKYKAPYWTTAAAITACLVWFIHSSSKQAVAFDDIVANFTKATSAKFEMSVEVTDQPKMAMRAFYKEPAHFRQELTSGYVNISDWSSGKTIGLDSVNRQATVINLVNLPDDAEGKMQVNMFEGIRQLLQAATKKPELKLESLGTKQIDGQTAVGFRYNMGPQPTTVWADPRTELPIRIEAKMIGPPETKVAMFNYEFNIDLDDSLFDMSIPEGYKVLETKVDASPATESDFVKSLKMCADVLGAFPEGFDAAATGRSIGTYLGKRGSNAKEGPTAEQLQEIGAIARGFQFVVTLAAASDAHYAGAEAQPGNSTQAIFWYKPDGAELYRVLFADLSVREQAESPEVPNATRLRQ